MDFLFQPFSKIKNRKLYAVNNIHDAKVIMQGKLTAVASTLHTHIETSSLWAEFVSKNRCISVRFVSEEVKSIKF